MSESFICGILYAKYAQNIICTRLLRRLILVLQVVKLAYG